MEDRRLALVLEHKVKLCASCLIGRQAGAILSVYQKSTLITENKNDNPFSFYSDFTTN
jgi:hypothetical protein